MLLSKIKKWKHSNAGLSCWKRKNKSILKKTIMKSIISYISLLLLLSQGNSYGQSLTAQCPVMPDFSTACASDGTCQTWADGCGAGWTRSHGTPQMKQYTYDNGKTIVTSYYAYMWSARGGTNGEVM